MGQVEIFKFLAKQRLLGSDSYFSIKELSRKMSLEGLKPSRVRFCVAKLIDFGFLDINEGYPKRFRAKLKIIRTMQASNKQMIML